MTTPVSASDVAPGLEGDSYLDRTQLGAILAAIERRGDYLTASLIALATIAIYLYTTAADRQPLDYFVRLADAFLHGRITLLEAPSWLNELIPAGPGEWYVAYPPFPAVVLVPIVALFGTDIHEQIVSSVIGGASVGLVWLLLVPFALSRRARFVLTATFGLGTVLWYVSEVGSTWYLAHDVAVFCLLAALNLAVRGRAPFLVGLLLGCAATSRLPVALAAPFVALVVVSGPAFAAANLRLGLRTLPGDLRALLGGSRTASVRAISAVAAERLVPFAIGLAIPLALYGLYNLVRWGTPFDEGYVRIPGVLEDPIYADHGILSVWYVPRNLFAIFLRSWNFVDQPPYLQPSWWGLSIFLTTPLYVWLFRARLRDPRGLAALVGTVLVAIPIVTHGNVGITQFGYRFSLDFQPLLFLVLATVFERGMSRLAVVAAAASVLICAYGLWAIGIGFVDF